MGYCHYWGRPAELPLSGFRPFVEECAKLRRALGVPWLGLFGGVKIGNSFGWGRPIFREDVICFNGRPSHEPLIIYRAFHEPQRKPGKFGLYWDFVKTNQKPYDELVVAVLVSFKNYFPPLRPSPPTGARRTGRAASPSTNGPPVGRRPASKSCVRRRRRQRPSRDHASGLPIEAQRQSTEM